MTPSWTRAEDVDAALTKLWTRGRILAGMAGGETVFPLRLRVRGPDSAALSNRFGDVQAWIKDLEAASRTGRGFGFDLAWREVRHRQIGRNRIPCEITVPNATDGLQLIRKQAEAKRFSGVMTATAASFPKLIPWLARRPLLALEHAADWPRILAVLSWFQKHPASGLYLRQVDIPQVDTKFIELRRGLLTELLEVVLHGDAPPLTDKPLSSFEARYGLRNKPATVRFRLLEAASGFSGLTDISTPAEEFARLDLSPRAVFITENEVNGLAFPPLNDAIVLFGLGYGLDLLATAAWLRRARIHYWGDIDTHGFAMLDRLRTHFPQATSFLMDESTLLAHQSLWVTEDRPFLGNLLGLSEPEHCLFEDLKSNRFGERIRLEQERIAYSHVMTTLRNLGF